MQLSVSDLRILIEALQFRSAAIEQEQARLDDTQEERIAELSNDIYYIEFLQQSLQEEYQTRINEVCENYQSIDATQAQQNKPEYEFA
jgi:hypothetical protein